MHSALLSSEWRQQEVQHYSSNHPASHGGSVGMQGVALQQNRLRQK